MKSAFSFLPRGFGGLLDYISPSAFEVIDWQAALKKSGSLTKELIFETSLERLKEQFSKYLPLGAAFGSDGTSGDQGACQREWSASQPDRQISSKSIVQRQGQRVLEIYFLQLFCCKEVFLDLRKERFLTDQKGVVDWNPNGLWYKFSDVFLSGIKDIYAGFYTNSEESLQSGLYRLGLFSDHMSTDTRAQLRELLDRHFGQGKSAPMKFEVSHFMSSFDSLFLFLKKHKLKLSEDFLFLGIYILTLYMHLETLGESFDVCRAYQTGIEKGVAK